MLIYLGQERTRHTLQGFEKGWYVFCNSSELPKREAHLSRSGESVTFLFYLYKEHTYGAVVTKKSHSKKIYNQAVEERDGKSSRVRTATTT